MPAYYRGTLSEFTNTSDSEILGILATRNARSRFPLAAEQIDAWKLLLPPLKSGLQIIKSENKARSDWSVLLEYPIPVIGERLDCVVLCGNLIFVIEYKSSASNRADAIRQVEDYALNLSNF